MVYDAFFGGEEKVGSMFQPDTLLHGQYFESVRRKANSEPEKKLMLVILEDAVDCFQKYLFVPDAKAEAIFADSEQWIMEENSNWIFSFENVCISLGFNPGYVRQGLLRWMEMKLAEHSNSKSRRE